MKPLTIARDAVLVIVVTGVVTLTSGLYTSLLPEKIVSDRTPADAGLSYEDVRLTTSDGIELAGWYVPAKTPSRSAVLILHGYPADKGDLVDRAAFLADHYALLFIDLRYFGESEGAFTTAGAVEARDALAGIAYLRERGAVQVGVYGFSVGGAIALMALDHEGGADAVVAESSYATLERMAFERYRNLGPLKGPFARLSMTFIHAVTGVDTNEVSPLTAAERTRKPVLLIHSTTDTTIPFDHAESLRDALASNPKAAFAFSEGLPHGVAPPNFERVVETFFMEHL